LPSGGFLLASRYAHDTIALK